MDNRRYTQKNEWGTTLLRVIRRRKRNWIGHILLANRLPTTFSERTMGGDKEIEALGRYSGFEEVNGEALWMKTVVVSGTYHKAERHIMLLMMMMMIMMVCVCVCARARSRYDYFFKQMLGFT